MAAIPIVDFAPFSVRSAYSDRARASTAGAWDAAMKDFGFAQIVNHGVDAGLGEALERGARAFFARPDKARFSHGPYGNPRRAARQATDFARPLLGDAAERAPTRLEVERP